MRYLSIILGLFSPVIFAKGTTPSEHYPFDVEVHQACLGAMQVLESKDEALFNSRHLKSCNSTVGSVPYWQCVRTELLQNQHYETASKVCAKLISMPMLERG